MRSVLASGFAADLLGIPSMSDLGTTSSAKRIVDIANAFSNGRIAARYCLLRITTVPIAARSRSCIAANSRLYGFVAASSVGTSQYVRS
jgi:hypothetical protein